MFRKIHNGFCTEWGIKLSAHIRAAFETACRRAIGALPGEGIAVFEHVE